ncbi:hypothetical protein N0V83_005434 [Neocucurbitaria cava]|uniref:Uncharacterized protein n=1 Tax=Neocucurbitaria cava TaxID=798079 RepID=A0A9W9CM85_9PLEO|nr:hypothetical protein N0V83_005434 [Neocucurbitaria cava]
MDSQGTTPKQRPARYRQRTQLAPNTPVIADQTSALSQQMSSSAARSSNNPAGSQAVGLTTPLFQGQPGYPPPLQFQSYHQGFEASQFHLNNQFGNIRYSYPMPGGSSRMSAIPQNQFPQTSGYQHSIGGQSTASWNPNFTITGLPSPQHNQQLDARWPSQPLQPVHHHPSQYAQFRATGYYHDGNDRMSLPSQQYVLPPRPAFSNHHSMLPHNPGSRSRMINIRPPMNYPTADGLARPPTPYTNHHASIPTPALTGFGMPGGKGFSENKELKSSSTSNPNVTTTAPRGHRRNKPTISKLEDVGVQQVPRKSDDRDLKINSADMSSTQARETYPLDEFVPAGAEHDVDTFDLAYTSSAQRGKKHVRFASHSDHAPSTHYPSGSEDTTASTRSTIDLGEYKEPVGSGRTIFAVPRQTPKADRDDTFLLPTTTYKPPGKHITAETDKQNITQIPTLENKSVTDLNRSLYTTANKSVINLPSYNYNEHADTNPNSVAHNQHDQPTQKHTRSASLSSVLRRATNGLQRFAAARAGMAPVRDDNRGGAVLDRGFQFPARGAEQSARVLRSTASEECDKGEEIGKGKGRERRVSFGRVLERFGGRRK